MVIPVTVQVIPPGFGIMLADNQANKVVVVERLHFISNTTFAGCKRRLRDLRLPWFIEQHTIHLCHRRQNLAFPQGQQQEAKAG